MVLVLLAKVWRQLGFVLQLIGYRTMAHSKNCGVRWAFALLMASRCLFAQSGSGLGRPALLSAEGWHAKAAIVHIQILRHGWDTWSWRLGAALGFCLLLWVAHRARVAQLARRLNSRFEERLLERTRVAEELHDTLLQGFLSASMQLDVAAGQLPRDSAVRQQLNRVLELMGTVSAEGRRALQNLRSPEGLSIRLEEALAQVEQEFARDQARVLPALRIVVGGRARPMHPLLRDEVYWIGREAMVNAFRHSHAKHIEVLLEYSERQFGFLIHDDGGGIDPEALRNGREDRGLSGMRKRAEGIGAQLRLWSRKGIGTRIELSVPGRLAFRPFGQHRGDSAFTWRSMIQFFRDSFCLSADTQEILQEHYKHQWLRVGSHLPCRR